MKKQSLMIICLLTVLAVAFACFTDSTWAAPKLTKQKVTSVKVTGTAGNTIVSWKKVIGSGGYMVYASRWKNKNYKPVAAVKPSVNKVKVTTLAGGKVYYFRVRAYKKSGSKIVYSKLSNRVRYFVKPAPAAGKLVAPKVPAATVRAVEPTLSKMRISITSVKGASGYEIWRSAYAKGNYTRIKTLGAGTLSFVDSGLAANKWYYYKVRAYSAKGKSKAYSRYSSVVSDTTGGNSVQFNLDKVAYKSSPLKGKRILFLGSSITNGISSGNVSFVEYLVKKHGVKAVAKEAVNGTTISCFGNNNYVERLEKYDRSNNVDVLVCQLSTNDSRNSLRSIRVEDPAEAGDEAPGTGEGAGPKGKDGEEISEPLEVKDGDETSGPLEGEEILTELGEKAKAEPCCVEDAIKYIIAYSNIRLGCRAVFYVCPKFRTTETFDGLFYAEMRDCLLDVDSNWTGDNEYGVEFDSSVIDLWGDPALNSFSTYNEARSFYMMDSVHPTKAGYYRKFLPAFEAHLIERFK